MSHPMITDYKKLEIPCSLGLTSRVHEERCDASFSVFWEKQVLVMVFFSRKEDGE